MVSANLPSAVKMHLPLEKLDHYYDSMQRVAMRYIRDPKTRDENVAVVEMWREKIKQLVALIGE